MLYSVFINVTAIGTSLLESVCTAQQSKRLKMLHNLSWVATCRQGRLIDDDVEDMADIPDGELCVVCLLRRRRAAFIHCGHRVCCVSCAQHVEQDDNPRCPVCRQTVTGIVRVFDS
jgi:hypothetical protein